MGIRPGQVLALPAATAASLACSYVGYRIVGWAGVGIFGLLMMLVAVQVELDGVAPVADAQNTGLFAATMASQAAEGRAENAGRWADAASRKRTLLLTKLLGAVITVVGGIGFFVYQLPR